MKILFAAPENAWDGFFKRVKAMLPEHEFVAQGKFEIPDLSGVDILIPTMTRVTPEILDTADRLKLIQQCGSGLELVDIQAAKARGIDVANVPTDLSGNADSVAELGIFMMIGLARQANQMHQSFTGRVMGTPMGMALKGKTVGIVGLGGIGKALARRLSAFGTNLVGIKQSDPEKARQELDMDWVGGPRDLGKLLDVSDFVVLCLPLTPDSQGLIARAQLRQMKPTAFLINLSRGGLVDHQDLTTALKENQIAGAGLDVFWQEPPDPEDDIFSCNVIATPHIAGATDISMQGIAQGVAQNIERTALGKRPVNLAW